MADLLKLNVQERSEMGKGPNRRLRASGMVPGIYYDAKGANIPVKVQMVPLQKTYAAVGNSQVFELVLERGGKTETMPALLWRVRNEPVKGVPEHVDFFGVDLTKEIKVAVPFEIVGNSKGVKLGGVMEQYREHIEVICKPMDIPEAIVIDITDLDVMDHVHIEDVTFPEGVTPVFEENFAILSIAAMQEEGEGEEGETAAPEAAAE
ncbi:ribosomal 5S rRNA E-loop binding protein Ctc/L25/TL5 [Pseudodesulfovibrio mercurii]|uniref:Large ribosomal subunit protein bL25 n=1 Tax=Pseudodesulfovibrio mercurii TaxID=641491 RepID=F0JKD1_9BACT|nr:50S ribosomal protein L25 [Pseudodesulfovibrio mercurii]EGB16380.1 ribosomal 5S rRNA E-loop binding protein Ctc/L25/TL5 [Pseudodesulfovibrio mercurii]